MKALRMKQNILFDGDLLEEWCFDFGFVIPGSTNSWEQTIEAAEQSEMIPAETLSGNILIETEFFDGPNLISQSKVRIFYV